MIMDKKDKQELTELTDEMKEQEQLPFDSDDNLSIEEGEGEKEQKEDKDAKDEKLGIPHYIACKFAEEFFRKNSSLIIKKATIMLKNSPNVPLEAEDLLSQAWITIHDAVTKFDARLNKNLDAYLMYRNNFGLRDTIRDFSTKKHEIMNNALPLDENSLTGNSDNFDPIENIEAKIKNMTPKEVYEVIRPKLPTKLHKEIFELLFLKGLKKNVISKQLDISYYKLRRRIEEVEKVVSDYLRVDFS